MKTITFGILTIFLLLIAMPNAMAGDWYSGTGGEDLRSGGSAYINFNHKKLVTQIMFYVGCNDNEELSGFIEYYDDNNNEWKYLTSISAGCGTKIDISKETSALRLRMTGGGGRDNRISWYGFGSQGWRVYADDIQNIQKPVETIIVQRSSPGFEFIGLFLIMFIIRISKKN